MTPYNKLFRSIFVAIIFIAFFSFYIPNITKAMGSSDSVPVSLEDDQNTIDIRDNTSDIKDSVANIETNIKELRDKAYIKDKEAVQLSRAFLYNMSNAIVNWVQTNFSDNDTARSAFINDPRRFFQREGEDTTVKFIRDELDSACSPFASSTRRLLALEQSDNSSNADNTKYNCTLDSNNDNTKMTAFLSGDFSQGGWDMFGKLVEPQNHPNGLYLLTKDDLNTQILQDKADTNSQLDRGSGYLTMDYCKKLGTYNINTDTFSSKEAETANMTNDPSVTVDGPDSNSILTFKRCTTGTPGSMIADIMNKQLSAGTDVLISVQDMNGFDTALDKTATHFAQRVLYQGFLQAQVLSTSSKKYDSPAKYIVYDENIRSSFYASTTQDKINANINAYSSSSRNLINQNTNIRNDTASLNARNTEIATELGQTYGTNSSNGIMTDAEVKTYCANGGSNSDPLCTEYTANSQKIADNNSQETYNTGIGVLDAKQGACYGKQGADLDTCEADMAASASKYSNQLQALGYNDRALSLIHYSQYSRATAEMFASINRAVSTSVLAQTLIGSVKTAINGTGVMVGGNIGYTAAQDLNNIVVNGLVNSSNASAAATSRAEIKAIYNTYLGRLGGETAVIDQMKAETNSLLRNMGEPNSDLIN